MPNKYISKISLPGNDEYYIKDESVQTQLADAVFEVSGGPGSSTYQPIGTVSATVSLNQPGTTTTINSVSQLGSLQTITASVTEETLTIRLTGGSLPTITSVAVKTGDATYTASASFSGEGTRLTGTLVSSNS